jgi:23S rRNA pseudouridine1911/1915/1917 synthase
MARIEHILTNQPHTLSDLLDRHLKLNPEQTFHLLWLGSIYLDKKRLKCTQTEQWNPLIPSGSYLRVHREPKRFPLSLEQLRTGKIDEDENLLVVDKPAGLPVHPTLDNQQENLLRGWEAILQRPLFITHRLDVGTSGLLLLAKNPREQSRLNRIFQEGQVKKIYQATVHCSACSSGQQELPLGEIRHWMKPGVRAPRKVLPFEVTSKPDEGLICRMRILRWSRPAADQATATIELLTGRTHQIRAQLSQLGFPIWGDRLYGSSVNTGAIEQWSLRCVSLSFPDTDGKLRHYSLETS